MKNKKDLTEKEKYNSFKTWFKIMNKNSYIFLFLLGFCGTIFQIVMWDEMMEMVRENYSYSTMGAIMVTIGMLIPISIASVVAYKGFWQFWKATTLLRRE